MHLRGKQLLFCLNGRYVELEALPGQMLRASYGLLGGRNTLHVSSYSDSTPEAAPVRSWTFDGIGWTPGEPSFIDESREAQSGEASTDLPSSSGDAFSPRLKDGEPSTLDWAMPMSSTGKDNESINYGALGKQRVNEQWLKLLPMTSEERERLSSCLAD